MATWAATQNLNFSSANWNAVDSTSYLNTEAATTSTTNSYVYSTTFTPGAIVVAGVMVRGLVTSTVGTFSVQLYDNTSSSQVAVVTCNNSDIESSILAGQGGWIFLKFSSSQTLTAGHAYKIGILSSTSSTMAFYRSATAGDWARALVTTTTGSLAAGDNQICGGVVTGPGSNSTVTITMDNTAATAWGYFDLGFNSIWVNGTSASAAYLYTQANNQQNYIAHNASFTVGTTSGRIPSTSSAVYTFASNAVSGATTSAIYVRGTASMTAAGQAKTRFVRQTANFSAGATSITCASVSGYNWLSGDLIGIGATDRSATPAVESKTLTATPTSTTLTISATTYAKTVRTMNTAGAVMAAPLINLSSNVSFNGTSATSTTSIVDQGYATVLNFDNVLFTGFGGGATSTYAGISNVAGGTNTAAHSWTFNSCAFNNNFQGSTTVYLLNFSATQPNINGSFTITNNVFYSTGQQTCIYTAVTNNTLTTCLVNGNVTVGGNFNINHAQVNFQNNVINGTLGVQSTFAYNCQAGTPQTWSSNSVECSAISGGTLSVSNGFQSRVTVGSFNIWFSNGYGLTFTGSTNANITGFSLIGNSSSGTVSQSFFVDTILDSFDYQSNSTYTQPYGYWSSAGNLFQNSWFQNSTFGNFSGHSVSDFYYQNGVSVYGKIITRNTTVGSTTQVTGVSQGWVDNGLYIQKSAGVVGSNRSYVPGGRTDTDSTITYSGNTYSLRMTPSSATQLLYANLRPFLVQNGSTATLTIYIRKSNTSAGDSATYNGIQPYIVLRSQDNMGHANYQYDQTIITADNNANGAFYAYTYTLPSAAADNGQFSLWAVCTGTAGFCNIGAVIPS